jgi:hypothetical protein
MATSKSNTLIVLDSTTIAANIKPAYLAELMECSKATGKSLSRLMNEAFYEFMSLQGAIYMNDAGHPAPYRPGPKQRQKA